MARYELLDLTSWTTFARRSRAVASSAQHCGVDRAWPAAISSLAALSWEFAAFNEAIAPVQRKWCLQIAWPEQPSWGVPPSCICSTWRILLGASTNSVRRAKVS